MKHKSSMNTCERGEESWGGTEQQPNQVRHPNIAATTAAWWHACPAGARVHLRDRQHGVPHA